MTRIRWSRLLIGGGLLVVAILICIWAVMRLPRATIIVVPATREHTIEQTITLSANTTDPDFQRLVLPAHVIEKTVTVDRTVEREGGTATPDYARGVVTLHNEQDEEQPLLTKTHLKHEESGTFFLTDRAVRLPVQGSLEVPVTAKEQGKAGNVPAGRFVVDKLPDSLKPFVYGNSSVAFSGGEVYDTPVTTEELEDMQKRIEEAARDEVRSLLLAETAGAPLRDELTSFTVENSSVSVEPGSTAASYAIRLELKAQAFTADENDLLSLTLLALRDGPDGDEELTEYDPASFTVSFSRADFERGEARVTTSLTGTVNKKTESAVFDTSNLAGRSPAEVQEYYQQFESVAEATTELSPFWVTTVPPRSDAVDVIIQTENFNN